MNLTALYLRLVEHGDPASCWPWLGYADTDGYPRMWDGTKVVRAARWAAVNIYGWELPADALLCHHCDNPPCCNPAHWYVGSHLTNQRDRWRRNRGNYPTKPVLTKAIVDLIADLTRSGENPSDIARALHLSRSSVYRARRFGGPRPVGVQP